MKLGDNVMRSREENKRGDGPSAKSARRAGRKVLVEGQRNDAQDHDQQPEREKDAEQQRGDDRDAAHVLGDVDGALADAPAVGPLEKVAGGPGLKRFRVRDRCRHTGETS